ncbi:hypothetical protein [Pontibacter rugosus]|uniref:Uncharacterized protein n=1 Tax=Pontibacter rugosus TaxID=1745966 RepID=A0ABW3SN26_9BACT
MKKGFIKRMLSGKELGFSLFLLALIVACLFWRSQNFYRDGGYGTMAAIFSGLLALGWLLSYFRYKPKP